MFIEKDIPNRQKDEQLILFLRRHWLVIVGHWLFYGVLFILPLILYYFFLIQNKQLLAFFQSPFINTFVILLISIYYLNIWLFMYNAFLDYYLDVWIVTNKRIINIEQKGLFNRRISEHELEKVQDVTGEQKGIFATFLTFGDVKIQTAGEIPMFIFKQINDPFEVVKTINHLLKNVKAKKEQEVRQYWKEQQNNQTPANRMQ